MAHDPPKFPPGTCVRSSDPSNPSRELAWVMSNRWDWELATYVVGLTTNGETCDGTVVESGLVECDGTIDEDPPAPKFSIGEKVRFRHAEGSLGAVETVVENVWHPATDDSEGAYMVETKVDGTEMGRQGCEKNLIAAPKFPLGTRVGFPPFGNMPGQVANVMSNQWSDEQGTYVCGLTRDGSTCCGYLNEDALTRQVFCFENGSGPVQEVADTGLKLRVEPRDVRALSLPDLTKCIAELVDELERRMKL